jgi:hypothetical protein
MTTSLVFAARRGPAPAGIFVGSVLAVAIAGGVLAIGAFTGGAADADHAHGAAIGEPIGTSFGSVTFERVSTIGGLTAQELGGVTHGIQNLVLTGQAQVEVSVLVVNHGDHRITVVPDQFSLLVDGKPGPTAMAGSTIRPLRLEPGGSVEATLTYGVPQSGAAMTVTYADPGGEAVSVSAGALDLVSAPPADGHTH